jgi:hypothetical protein
MIMKIFDISDAGQVRARRKIGASVAYGAIYISFS